MEEEEELEMEPADSFQRMLAHGLCEYHGLTTVTRATSQSAPEPTSGQGLLLEACSIRQD